MDKGIRAILLLLCIAGFAFCAADEECTAPVTTGSLQSKDRSKVLHSDQYVGPSVAAVLNWGTQSGIASKFIADASNLTVRGLTAAHDIPAKTTVVSMPRSMTIRLVMGQKSQFPQLSEDVWSSLGEHVKLGLLLLKEVKRGPESPWHLWVDSLPQQIDTLIHWSDAELQKLQMDTTPTERELLTHTKDQLADIKRDFASLQSTSLVSDLNISLEEVIWASDMVTSRSFAFQKQLAWWHPLAIGMVMVMIGLLFKAPFVNKWQHSAQIADGCRVAFTFCMAGAFIQNMIGKEGSHEVALLPIIDLINHNSTSQGELQASRFSSNLKAVSGPYPFAAGDEVYHSYGDKSNDVLLLFYGFVEMQNINDVYLADLAEYVQQNVNVDQERWQFLETDALVMQSLHQAALKQSGWPNTVLESLRYLMATPQEAEQRSALDPLQWFQALFMYREIPHVMTAWKNEVSEHTEHKVYQVLHGFCSHVLSSKLTSLEEDEKTLRHMDQDLESSSVRHKLAVQFRTAKKQLLKTCAWQYDPAQMAP